MPAIKIIRKDNKEKENRRLKQNIPYNQLKQADNLSKQINSLNKQASSSNKSKKAQISLFMIVGVIILVLVLLFYNSLNETQSKSLSPNAVELGDFSATAENVRLFADFCLNNASRESLVNIGKHGGYYPMERHGEITDEEIKKENLFGTAYWMIESRHVVPSLEFIQNELAAAIESSIGGCLNNFEPFTSRGMQINFPESFENTVSAKIEKELVKISFDYPLVIYENEKQTNIFSFESVIPARFGFLHDVGKEVIESNLEEPSFFCMSCAAGIAEKHNMNIAYKKFGTDYIFTLFEENNFPLFFALGYKEKNPFEIKMSEQAQKEAKEKEKNKIILPDYTNFPSEVKALIEQKIKGVPIE